MESFSKIFLEGHVSQEGMLQEKSMKQCLEIFPPRIKGNKGVGMLDRLHTLLLPFPNNVVFVHLMKNDSINM